MSHSVVPSERNLEEAIWPKINKKMWVKILLDRSWKVIYCSVALEEKFPVFNNKSY